MCENPVRSPVRLSWQSSDWGEHRRCQGCEGWFLVPGTIWPQVDGGRLFL